MAEQIIFGADIDNVTIKNINGKLTAVIDVENTADEFEVVTNYEEPQEDDDYYVESIFAKFRHKATQFLTDAFKKEKKPRSAPVNESFVEPITTEAVVGDSSIAINYKNTAFTSAIDGYIVSNGELDIDYDIVLNKANYVTAKAFNEAHAGKTFTVTTKKRYAESEGHPVVKPTEIQVAYPTLPYVEKTTSFETYNDSYMIMIGSTTNSGTIEENRILRELYDNGRSEHLTATYTVKFEEDGQLHTGTLSFTDYGFDRRDIPNYNNSTVTYEKYEFEPFVLENFNGKVTINPQPYELGTL